MVAPDVPHREFVGFMRFFSRLLVGLMLGRSSLSVVWRDKTLLFFPFTSFFLAFMILLQFYISVGQDKIQLLLNTQVNAAGVQYLNWGWYVALAVAYFVIYFVATFFNSALIGATNMSMNGKDTQFRDGIGAAVRNVHWTLLWAAFSSTFGILLRLADHERRASAFLRKRLGVSWSLLTYFVLPVMSLEGVGVLAAMARSNTIMSETWGENIRPRFSLSSFLVLLNLPVILFVGYRWWSGVGLNAWAVEGLLIYLALTIILAQTAKAVLTVALYRYATGLENPDCFRKDLLQGAFELIPGTEPAEAKPAPKPDPTA